MKVEPASECVRVGFPGRRRSRRGGLTFAEVAIVALIAGTALVYVMSLGQANLQLAALGRESFLARQISLDLVEYYAANFAEAKVLAASVNVRDHFEGHPAFGAVLKQSDDIRELYTKMNPYLLLRIQYNVEVPRGSGSHMSGLHRLVSAVGWREGGGKGTVKWVVASRLVSELP